MELGQITYRYFRTWLQLKLKVIKSALTKKHDKYSKFIILCSPRTGSTLLHTYLHSHPNINSLGEVLRKRKEDQQPLNNIPFELTGLNIKAVGFKYFYFYQQESCYSLIKEKLISDTSIKVIHLIRKDVKAQYRSLKIAEKTGRWNSHKSNYQAHNIEVDFSTLDDFDSKLKQQRKEAEDVFCEHPMLTVYYEGLTQDSDNTLRNIQRFLGVKERLLDSLLVKQS